jgi:hypothetical protein
MSPSRLPVFSPLLTLGLALSALAGPAWARSIADPLPTVPALVGLLSPVATFFSNPTTLSRKAYAHREVTFELEDGSRMGGLFFAWPGGAPGPRPLVIGSFGILEDRWGHAAGYFVREIVEGGLLAEVLPGGADVLIVDGGTSGAFYGLNGGAISPGGYDEGRMLREVAARLRSRNGYSSVHLLGVSLSGLASVHALLEDARLGTRFIDSVLTFSTPLDQRASMQDVMKTLGQPFALPETPGQPEPRKPRRFGFFVRNGIDVLWKRFEGFARDFGSPVPPVLERKMGAAVYQAFQRRIEQLRQGPPGDWNPEVDLSSVEAYVVSSARLVDRLADAPRPLLLVHARNDSVCPFVDFERFARRHGKDDRISTLATRFGGHWGFTGTYGRDWFLEVLKLGLR